MRIYAVVLNSHTKVSQISGLTNVAVRAQHHLNATGPVLVAHNYLWRKSGLLIPTDRGFTCGITLGLGPTGMASAHLRVPVLPRSPHAPLYRWGELLIGCLSGWEALTQLLVVTG